MMHVPQSVDVNLPHSEQQPEIARGPENVPLLAKFATPPDVRPRTVHQSVFGAVLKRNSGGVELLLLWAGRGERQEARLIGGPVAPEEDPAAALQRYLRDQLQLRPGKMITFGRPLWRVAGSEADVAQAFVVLLEPGSQPRPTWQEDSQGFQWITEAGLTGVRELLEFNTKAPAESGRMGALVLAALQYGQEIPQDQFEAADAETLATQAIGHKAGQHNGEDGAAQGGLVKRFLRSLWTGEDI